MQLSGGDVFRPWGQGAPYGQSGLLGPRDFGKKRRSRFGINPVGGDDEIVIAGAPVGEYDVRAIFIMLDRSGGDAALDLDARGDSGLGQDAVKVGTGDSDLIWPLRLPQRR